MMCNIAIGLAAATIAIGGSTLSASALSGQESGISKGSMSRSYDEERGRGGVAGYKPDRFDEVSRSDRGNRTSQLTPLQRERLKGIARERLADRERLRAITGGRYAELTWRQRAQLKRITRQLADLTPLQRERLRGIMRERYEQLSPLERERLYRHGAYGLR